MFTNVVMFTGWMFTYVHSQVNNYRVANWDLHDVHRFILTGDSICVMFTNVPGFTWLIYTKGARSYVQFEWWLGTACCS